MTTRPVLANAGAMSQFVGPFEVTSKLGGQTYQCRFSHMWNGIATRHADTIDTKFFVNGEAHVVGLAHTAFVKFRDKSRRDLTDRRGVVAGDPARADRVDAAVLTAARVRIRTEPDVRKPALWPPNTCASALKKKTSAPFTMSPRVKSCA